MIASIQELLQKEAQAVLNIPVTDAYERAVELIGRTSAPQKRELVTSGMGKAGQIAMNIATTFCSTGIPSVFLHPSEAQHGGPRHPSGGMICCYSSPIRGKNS